jgi:hypothetical protein
LAQDKNACCMNGGDLRKSYGTVCSSRRTVLLRVIIIIITLVKILTKFIPRSKSYALRTQIHWWR